MLDFWQKEIEECLTALHQMGVNTPTKQANLDDISEYWLYCDIKARLMKFNYAMGVVDPMAIGVDDVALFIVEPDKLWKSVAGYSYISGVACTAHFADHVQGMLLDKERFLNIVKVLSALLKEVK